MKNEKKNILHYIGLYIPKLLIFSRSFHLALTSYFKIGSCAKWSLFFKGILKYYVTSKTKCHPNFLFCDFNLHLLLSKTLSCTTFVFTKISHKYILKKRFGLKIPIKYTQVQTF